jgi:hypothetical protein
MEGLLSQQFGDEQLELANKSRISRDYDGGGTSEGVYDQKRKTWCSPWTSRSTITCFSLVQGNTGETENSRRSSPLFPVQLYQVLEAAPLLRFEDIVSWLPAGDGFRVHDRKRFEKHIMPRFFMS